MTEEELLISTFKARITQLLYQYDELEKANNEKASLLAEKDAEIEKLKEELTTVKKEYTNLKLAKMIKIGDDELHDAKQRISKLVREVDKCIALLKA